jgi:hypothetical protein
MNEDGTDYRYEWKGLKLRVYFIQCTLWHNNFMSIRWMSLRCNDKQKKNLSMLMGDLLVFSVMGAAASGYLAYFETMRPRSDKLS